MNLTFTCIACDQVARVPLDNDTQQVVCPHCSNALNVPEDAVVDDRVNRCVVCPCHELYVRKDFSQRVGVGIIVIGLAASCIPWAMHKPIWTYAILFATALVDLVLYFIVGNALHCYRCQAEYRGAEGLDQHGAFSLETHEKFRQQAARMKEVGG